ncbi:hypothetical protein F0259_06320 [Vibrio cyclitrophicus]|uniref:metallophosphoesterase family protein n=1 Tax=Vibrio cyclitrophicus TaxID=47951 RepID=UPI00148C9AC2|nr:metallophosphoesterase [Vibrio cyclitrophicus]NOH43428.1 hypothetical protein [Vibrio cyclitrophicus]
MPKSLIFRFRDFTIEPGETVEEHNKIAEEKGHVYWGWWSKSHETIPDCLLREELDVNTPIYLFDSGQHKLFRTTLQGVSNNNNGATAPETGEFSPEYYKTKKCKVWLKLGPIEEVVNSDQEVQKYAYHSHNNNMFNDDRENMLFSDFFDKQVSSLKELFHQERTIWFLQDYDQTKHTNHTIVLTNAGQLHPEVFSKSYKPIYGDKILWLTDIHFDSSSNHHFHTDARVEHSLASVLVEFAQSPDSKFSNKIDALICSGDMTFKATKDEFQQVEQLYGELASKCQLDNFNIVFCPGNHDITFADGLEQETLDALSKFYNIKVQPNDPSRAKLTASEWQDLKAIDTVELNKITYEEHFQKVTRVKPNEFLSMGRKFLVNEQRPVDICMLNSNTVQQYKDVYQGHGFVGVEQRDHAKKMMGWDKPKAFGAVRIVSLHHNLLPVEYGTLPIYGHTSNLVYDAQATIQWCMENDVDVVLHGHTHQRSQMKLSQKVDGKMKDLWVIGLGSSGASHNHLVPGHSNQFATLDFSSRFIAVNFFNITNGKADFSNCERIELEI